MKSLIIFLFFIILQFQVLYSLSLTEEVIDFPSTKSQLISQDISPKYITININNYDEIKDEYFHISTSSDDKTISPLIISSSTQNQPSIKNSDIYSTQHFGDAHLILGKALLNKQIYLSIVCNKIPCSFKINLELEENVTLFPGQIISFFGKNDKNNLIPFKIPSQITASTTNKSAKHILNIALSYSNSNSVESDLYLNISNSNQIKLDIDYNIGRGIIYSFMEEDLIEKKGGNINEGNFYILKVNHKNEEFITISVNSKEIYDTDIPTNKIIPNKGGIYSYLKKDLLKEECYSINTDLNIYKNSLIFASINFYSKPVNYYFIENNKKSDIFIPNQNSVNVILKDGQSDIYKDICFVLGNNNDEGVFKIEISETNDILNKKDIYDPLKTGSIYVKSLPIKGLTYYTHNPSYRIYTQMNFNLKVIKGRVEMFVVRCETFPDCSYTYEQLSEESKNKENDKVIKPHIINDMFSYSDYVKNGEKDLSPFNYKQNLMFVYCSEDTKTDVCQYEVSFFSENDKILLLNNDKFYQYMLKDEKDIYQIHIPKFSDTFSKIQIILYTFTGHSSLDSKIITNNSIEIDVKHDFVGEKEIYEYIPKTTYPINEKDFTLEFVIKAVTNCYYEVEYKIIKEKYDDTNLENNIFYNEKYTFISTDITFKDSIKYVSGDNINNKRYFVFQNNRIEENYPYLVQIFSLNCKINVKRQEKKITESDDVFQDIILNNETYYKNKYYIYEMNIDSIENYGDENVQNQCIVYLSGHPLDNDNKTKNIIYNNKILLTENDPHQIILANDTKSYRYLFPYVGNSTDYNSYMLVHINFDAKMSIKVKFYFDNSDVKKEETMGRSGQILLSNALIKENCKDIEQICNVIIEINFNNVDKYDSKTWSSPNFQLFISTNNKIPSYLKNGELRVDSVVKSNPFQYFYTDISKNSEGQVIINTKRGEGVLYARIYQKGKKDEGNNWGDIRIPDSETKDILKYDQFTHSVHFEKEQTKDCGENGCLLLITYNNIYSPSNNNNYLIGFTILTRLYNNDKTRQSVLDIPLKTYAYGLIEKTGLTYNYFKVYLPEDSEKIDFEVQCETCILYINKGEILPTPEKHDHEYYSKGKFGVYGLLVSGESIKNTYYTIRIESPIIASRYVTTYSLRVLLPTPSVMINYNIIPVDSDQNVNCDLSLYSNDGICYFILYIDDKANNVSDILAHVYTDVDLIDLEINANFIPKEVAERAELNEMLDYLPSSSSESTFSTENTFYSDYLLIDINQRKNNDYIIFGVMSDNSATVTFLSTFYTSKDKVISNPNTVQLMKLDPNTKINLDLATNSYYFVYIYSLYGSGEIKWKDGNNDERIHKFSEHELFSFTSSIKEGETIINSDNNNFSFYLWQDVRETGFIMNEMDFNMRERFIYTQSSLPLKYYCLLPLLKKDKKIIFEDLLFNIELYLPNDIGINKDNNLIIEGAILDMEIINKIKNAKSDENIIGLENKIKINYDLSINKGLIVLNKTYCENIWNNLSNKDGNPYLYISIKQNNAQSQEKHFDIKGELYVSFRNNSNYVIPQNQVVNTKIDIIENNISYYLYNLKLDGNYNKNKIILDISPNIVISKNSLLYSLIDYSNIKKLNKSIIMQNSTNIVVDETNSKFFGGKYHIEFKLNEKVKGIYLCLFIDKNINDLNDLKSINVLFKYSSYEPNYEPKKYEFDNSKINITIGSGNMNIDLNKIKKIENSKISYPNCEFLIRKIKLENKLPNEELSSIAQLQSVFEILYTYKDNKNEEANAQISLPYEKNGEEEYYISVIANLYDDNEKFAYDIIYLKDEKRDEGTQTNKSSKAAAIIAIVVIIVLICAIIIYLFFIKRKMNKTTENLMNISFKDGKGEPGENNILYENQNENQFD